MTTTHIAVLDLVCCTARYHPTEQPVEIPEPGGDGAAARLGELRDATGGFQVRVQGLPEEDEVARLVAAAYAEQQLFGAVEGGADVGVIGVADGGYVAGDADQARQFLYQFDWSRQPNGLTRSRYPSRVPQTIPYWSLHWVMSVYDYWLYTGDDIRGDLYEDGIVDFEDMRELADLWLYSCPHGWPLR